jgi:hypothetical protein
MLEGLRHFVAVQAHSMGLATDPAAAARLPCDHSDKTLAKSFVMGLSCVFYWVLAWQHLVLFHPPRRFHVLVYFLVGLFSVSADTGLFRSHPRLMRANQICDRWTATTGTLLVLLEIGIELTQRSTLAAAFMLTVLAVAIATLQQARHRVHSHGHDWGWVALHSLWHVIGVVGGAWVIHRASTFAPDRAVQAAVGGARGL